MNVTCSLQFYHSRVKFARIYSEQGRREQRFGANAVKPGSPSGCGCPVAAAVWPNTKSWLGKACRDLPLALANGFGKAGAVRARASPTRRSNLLKTAFGNTLLPSLPASLAQRHERSRERASCRYLFGIISVPACPGNDCEDRHLGEVCAKPVELKVVSVILDCQLSTRLWPCHMP